MESKRVCSWLNSGPGTIWLQNSTRNLVKILPILTCSSDLVAEKQAKQLDLEWNLSWWLDFHGFVWLVEAYEKVDYIAKFYGSNVAFEKQKFWHFTSNKHTTYLVENAAKKGVGQQKDLEKMFCLPLR